jgi:hypothetical protein
VPLTTSAMTPRLPIRPATFPWTLALPINPGPRRPVRRDSRVRHRLPR